MALRKRWQLRCVLKERQRLAKLGEESELQVREKCEQRIRLGNVKNRMQGSVMTAVGTCGEVGRWDWK